MKAMCVISLSLSVFAATDTSISQHQSVGTSQIGEVQQAPRFGAPTTTIGDADAQPQYMFSRVGGVRFVANNIVVADNGSGQLRFYDSRGRFVKSLGRKGSGPGEFRHLKIVQNWSSDTIVVFDQMLQRVSFVTPGGVFRRSVQLPPVGATAGLTENRDLLGIDREGKLVIESQSGSKPGPIGLLRRQVTVTRLGPGQQLERVGSYEGNEFVASNQGGRPTYSLLPFLQRFVAAIGPDRIYFVEGPLAVAAEQAFGKFGPLRHPIVFETAKITREQFTKWYEEELLTVNEAYREPTRKFYRDLYAPWTTRPVSRLLTDDARRIWVEEYSVSSPRRVAIYSSEFALLGIATLPDSFTMYAVHGNLVAGVTTDALGVERIEVRPILGL